MSHRYLVAVLITFFLNQSRSGIHTTIETFENFYVITKFADLSDFYEKLRLQNPQNESAELSDFDKDHLCKRIFGSKAAMNPAEDGYETQLKTSNYALFEELFKPVEIPKSVLPRMTFRKKRFKYKYVYDNSSKPRTFLVGGSEREENTFVCAVRKIDFKTRIDMYFVSDYGYNVNDSKDGETIIGRFVFFDSEIYGLAEERPTKVEGRHIRWTDYTARRDRYKVAEKWVNDPVCKLDSARKIRLCTYFCAHTGTECADRIAVQEPCQRREFTLRRDELYDGWMLACKISNRHPLHYNEPATYEVKGYVAHTHFNNEAFVFGKGLEGEPRFWFKLTKVPVVVQEQMIAD